MFSHSAWECGQLASRGECSYLPHHRQFSGDFRQSWLFDLASLTKLLVTAPLVIDRFFHHRQQFAKLTLGDVLPTTSFFENSFSADPSVANKLKSLSVAKLLSHTSGLRPWLNFYANAELSAEPRHGSSTMAQRHSYLEQVFRRASTASLFLSDDKKNAAKSVYSDIGYILLGYALERDSSCSLATLFSRWLSELQLPPGSELFYAADHHQAAPSAFIPTGFCPVRERQLQGEVHDENCYALGGIAGHAGLFGSLPALSLLLGRWFADHRVQTLIELTEGSKDGVGFRRGDDKVSAEFGGGKAIGHYGFTGTSLWLCPDRHIYSLLLTNRVIAGRLALSEIKKYRQLVYRYSQVSVTDI